MNLKSLYRFLSPKFQNVFLDYKVNSIPRFGENASSIRKNKFPGLFEIIEEGRTGYEAILNEVLQHKDIFWAVDDAQKQKVNPG